MEKNFFTTHGRIGRTTFWMRFISLTIVQIITQFVGGEAYTSQRIALQVVWWQSGSMVDIICISIYVVCSILIIIQAIKRIHDVGKGSGEWLIPFYNIYLFLLEGQNFDNLYGPKPKKFDEDEALDDFSYGLLLPLFFCCLLYAFISEFGLVKVESIKTIFFLVAFVSCSIIMLVFNSKSKKQNTDIE
jgi:uncharacterized membrane protein YhaH (DUF805 family)